MGRTTSTATPRQAPTQDELVTGFARIMWQRYRARVYLLGSRATGTATPASDYDLAAVSEAFRDQRVTVRVTDRYDLWHEAGGWGSGLDLHCYTPEEFRAEVAGLGYLGDAKRRGELIRISTRAA